MMGRSKGDATHLGPTTTLLPFLVHLVLGVGLVLVHVRAETSTTTPADAWTRMLSGPSGWTTMDQVLFAALMMLALEVLKVVSETTGGESVFWGGGRERQRPSSVASFFFPSRTRPDLSRPNLTLTVRLLCDLPSRISSFLSKAWVSAKRIPVRGKHLDDFGPTDRLFIALSKAQTGPFVYLLLRYCFYEPNVLWRMEDASLWTVLLPLPVIFLVYDFFYTLLHWFLHVKAVYPLVHKHHHHQKAPSRATDDAVNVHPVEYTLGEYNHMLALFLCCRCLGLRVHIVTVVCFLAVGGVLAGWNHTRFDIEWTVLGGTLTIYDSKAHDVHHRIPQCNYGQYTMFWDYVFGTYRRYDPADRVNPRAQLDPKTGKSLDYSPPSTLKGQ